MFFLVLSMAVCTPRTRLGARRADAVYLAGGQNLTSTTPMTLPIALFQSPFTLMAIVCLPSRLPIV
ncbi:hypothetical protein AB0B45_47655 [Nonomuraea sp. NPDC049152]|uniref:hypothetical protein n=1 Tax=Nonomuraea sp. NPDC049152 TaxID=3154350 RepID=UPI0033D57842